MIWIILGVVAILVAVSVYCCFRINYFDEDIDFEMAYFCDKIFITNHFNCHKDITLLDVSDFMKHKTIHVNRYYTREPHEGEIHGRTELYGGPAALYKLKDGRIIWRRL